MSKTSDPSRDLLFGLLALQNGLIDQGGLFTAFAAWTREKSRSLADHLANSGGLDVDDRLAVDAMVARHLTKHGNDVEKSLAAIPAGRSTREGLTAIGEPAIEASLIRIGSAVTREETEAERTASYAVGTATSDGLRFRILRPHAQGGLGAVFVALDSELNREVALKQILEKHADDPVSRARFLLEAEVTGGLEHPGIVPVYGLGAYSDGRPYYAMRFIKGDSLKQAIDRFHTGKTETGDPGRRSLELRGLLRRFTDVCNAIEYAHSRGVLHRDIKPGNIIVGRHGETLVVDWGLAKALGKSDPAADERTLMPCSASGSSETLPGSAMGTPAYMSPEQAAGNLEALGPRSDVYSLGATLYHLLTGRPAVAGENIGAILGAVLRGELVPPRQVDPSIDSALEALCLKAMALRPADRYDSCRALADDLERWLADEPVSAWREPFSRRARRWARRNRTAVTAAAVALIAGAVGLVAVAGVQASANSSLRAANAEINRANTELAAEKGRVQERYNLATEAIETFHTGVSEDFLLKQEQFKDVRDRLLKSASDFYGKLGALLGKESSPTSRRALWQANYELAMLTAKVAKPEDALSAHRQVLAAREALASENSANPEINADVGRSLTAIAGLLEATGRTGEAEVTYRKAVTALADLAPSTAQATAARVVLAYSRSRLGWLLHITGRDDEALSVYRLARADQEALAGAPGASAESRRDLAATVHGVASVLSTTGKSAEAAAEYRNSLAIQQKLAQENPAVTEFRADLALTHNNLALLLAEMGDTAEAAAEHHTALAIQQKLADDNPAVNEFRGLLAQSHNNVGILLADRGNSSEAEAEYRKSLALYQKLADDNPAVASFRSRLALARANFGLLLAETGKSAEAAAEFRKALAIPQKLSDNDPAVTEFRRTLAIAHTGFGNLLAATGKSAEAAAEFQKALAIHQKLADNDPAGAASGSEPAQIHHTLGALYYGAGKLSEADAEYREALSIFEKQAEDNPTASEPRTRMADIHNNLGHLLRDSGKSSESHAEYQIELALRQKLASDNPSVLQFQRNLANSLVAIGWSLAQSRRTSEAMAFYTREEAIRQKLAETSSATPADRNFLANCLTNKADFFRRSGMLGESIAACERSLAVSEPLVAAHPEFPRFRATLAETYLRLGQVRCDMRNLAEAASAWKRSRAHFDATEYLDGEQTFFLACCQASLAGLAVRPGSGVSAAEAAAQAEKAMAALRQAVALGYRDPDAYQTESALDALRNRPDFRALMMDTAFPITPFAH